MRITSSMRHVTAVGVAAGALILGAAGNASADPPPNCTTADRAGIQAGVGFSMSGYLFTHPDVNAFFTSLQGLPRDQIRNKVQEYLAANPQVSDDIAAIRQPNKDFRSRCDVSGSNPVGG
jgi:hemophore-related protein